MFTQCWDRNIIVIHILLKRQFHETLPYNVKCCKCIQSKHNQLFYKTLRNFIWIVNLHKNLDLGLSNIIPFHFYFLLVQNKDHKHWSFIPQYIKLYIIIMYYVFLPFNSNNHNWCNDKFYKSCLYNNISLMNWTSIV